MQLLVAINDQEVGRIFIGRMFFSPEYLEKEL